MNVVKKVTHLNCITINLPRNPYTYNIVCINNDGRSWLESGKLFACFTYDLKPVKFYTL